MRIAVLDDYQGVARSCADWSSVEARANVVIYRTPLGTQQDVIAELSSFDAVCLMRERTPFPAAVIDALPELKLIVTTGMQNASIDMAAARARGIKVAGTQSRGYGTAELAFGLIVATARNIMAEAHSLSCGGWQVGLGRELNGATLAIVGLGRLGRQVARIGKAFGMDAVAWSENLTEERCAEVGARRASTLSDLLKQGDFVTIHTRLSDRTRGLIGAGELALMKPDAVLINTSRAAIIDEEALGAALSSGRIGGAALDVFDEEPLPAGHPLHGVPNLLMTPHLGYVTRENYAICYRQTVEALEAFLDGTPLREIPEAQ